MAAGQDEETLELEIVGVRFRSDDGSFAVIDAMGNAESGGPAAHQVVVGPVGHLEPGDRVRATGQRQRHPKHGERFRVRALQSMAPEDDAAVSRVLQRVPGVGPVAAEQLIERFGPELLERIDADPRDILRRVKGLTGAKLSEAVEAWKTEAGPRAVRLLLERHGLDAATIGRVIRALGDEPDVALLQSDPYRLTARSGIGFPTADSIALALGEARDSDARRRAGAVHALRQAEDDGHCHLPHDELVRRTVRLLLGRDAAWSARDELAPAVAVAVRELVADGQVVERDGRIATLELDEDEALLASLVARMSTDAPTLEIEVADEAPGGEAEAKATEEAAASSANATSEAKPAERDGGTPTSRAAIRRSRDPRPSPEQWEAVRLACGHRLSILTGGPGTGKTQTMRALVQVLRDAHKQVLLCAPTGKAARRLAEATGADATTIHRLLGYVPGEGFQHDEEDPIPDGGMLVVDEASMLPLDLAVALLRAVGPRTHVLLVGDVDQLAPVGPGRVLQDLLDSGSVPAVRLSRIFRQAERSLIVRAAHAMNRGEPPQTQPGPDDLRDFFLIDRIDPEAAADEVISLATRRLPTHYDVPAVGGVQILAPQRRGACRCRHAEPADAGDPQSGRPPGQGQLPTRGRPGHADPQRPRVGDHERRARHARAGRRRRRAAADGRRPSGPAAAGSARHLGPRLRLHGPQGAGLERAGGGDPGRRRAPPHADPQPALHRGHPGRDRVRDGRRPRGDPPGAAAGRRRDPLHDAAGPDPRGAGRVALGHPVARWRAAVYGASGAVGSAG